MTLDLTINGSYVLDDTLRICTGDSALLAGSYQTVNGTYVDTLQSVAGCDSIITTVLQLDTILYSTTDLELCYGDSVCLAEYIIQLVGCMRTLYKRKQAVIVCRS